MMGTYKTNTVCRICASSELEEVISLGATPLANAFVKKEDFDAELAYPLRAYFCHSCNLLQLLDVVDSKELFSHYVYFTSVMPTTPKHFLDYAHSIMRSFIQNPAKELVVEIGSNDGLLLQAFKEKGAQVLGVDPAVNIAKLANERGIPTIADFFSERLAKQIKTEHGPAKAIIGNNVVAHIDDHHDLLRGVKHLLAPKGVFVLEAPYLVDMFENLSFDTIYHEHLSYLAVRPLSRLFEQFDMEVFDVQLFPVQGTSIRVFACHRGEYPIAPSVRSLIQKELALGLDAASSYHALMSRIEKLRDTVMKKVRDLKKEGEKLAAYGAPAKGNTLLNYFKLGSDLLDYATEELPLKVGFYTPGMHLPVIHIDEARTRAPDYYVMLAWNYKKKILEKEAAYLKAGGHFIVPVGDVEVI
jgi:SAM-dependent methyltransferase